jgi:ribosome-associated heat shock protein Hsp15
MEKVRIDKWLWAARFFKTRSLAAQEVSLGRVQIDGLAVKPSREVRVGDKLTVAHTSVQRTVVVKGVSEQRGPAPVAQMLYEETAESAQKRAAVAQQRRLSPEPALAIEGGRPTKRDRRDLQKNWGTRWSASID